MSSATRPPSLLQSTLMLLAGGAAAQLLPLLLGPWITRLYSPEDYGTFQLFWSVAANLAVVACARYEFAVPLALDAAEARALRRLCLHLLTASVLATAVGALVWWEQSDDGQVWRLWLPVAVAALGGLSLATLWSTRQQCFHALAAARVLQHGGAAVGQVFTGLLGLGVHGLIVAPVAASALAAARLTLAARPVDADEPSSASPARRARDVARRWRDFPLWNTPHAFLGALQDTVAIGLIAWACGPAAAGFWGLAMRYLKAPATLVGGAVSQAIYPRLAGAEPGLATPAGRRAVAQVMGLLALGAVPLVVGLWTLGPWAFEQAFGREWRDAGTLARALALYIGAHFIASPLGVVTMAWGAQAWALRLALVGQGLFVVALAVGLWWGRQHGSDGLAEAGWAVSIAMTAYFGAYFLRLARWPTA